MIAENTPDIRLLIEFQKIWPLDRVKNMTIEEYHTVGSTDSFTYWLENKLDIFGSIWGGSAFKFGVFNRKNTDPKISGSRCSYNNDYGWYTKYGSTPEEVFINVKQMIIKIIEATQSKRYADIDTIDLGDAYKWKIAFHYQDFNAPDIVGAFKDKILDADLNSVGLPLSGKYALAKQKYHFTNIESMLNASRQIWTRFNENHKKTIKDEITDFLENQPDNHARYDDIVEYIRWVFPDGGPEQSRYVKEVLTDRYKYEGSFDRLSDDEFALPGNEETNETLETIVFGKEGAPKQYYTTKYERNPKNRAAAIKIHGTKCCVCGFDFQYMYGERGNGFIEVHHIKPLSDIKTPIVINPAEDLVCVCSNCHRMLHRRKNEIITPDELRKIIKQ